MSTFSSAVDLPFCESKYLKGAPVYFMDEFANSVSSLGMVFLGLYGMYYGYNKEMIVKLLHALLLVCGVGSILFHADPINGFRLFDNMPMILLMAIGTAMIVDEVLHTRYFEKDPDRYNELSSTFTILLAFYLVMIIIAEATGVPLYIFITLFALPYFVIGPTYFYVWRHWEDFNHFDNPKAVRMLWYSFGSGAVGGVLWGIDLTLCVPWIAWLRFHGFWHLLIGYSTYTLIEFISYLRANNYGCVPRLTWRWKVLPSVSWNTFSSRV